MRIKDELKRVFEEALWKTGAGKEEVAGLVLEKPKLKAHGDIATPIALTLAKKLKRNPLELAEQIAESACFPEDIVTSVQVAKPGFINLTLAGEVLQKNLLAVIDQKDTYGSSSLGGGAKIQVEYISANPTGPLVVVSARAAAIGSVLVNLLSFTDYDAKGEYYVNDYGKQVEALGESVGYRLRERFNLVKSGEEIGTYPGEYLKALAAEIPEAEAKKLIDSEAESSSSQLGKYATEKLLSGIKKDLVTLGVEFDCFFHESSLYPECVEEALRKVKKEGFTYEKDGALFFNSSRLGDEKDRVLQKSNGDATYFLGDIAYHLSKLQRGFKGVIDIWGPDHHGHIRRMQAAAQVLGAPPGWLEVMIVGWVRLVEGGRPVGMSKRAGEFITMKELVDDVGSDVTRYFFLMRRPNTPLDFDLELARKQSEENPVYYIQYAHARIASVIRFARSKGVVRSASGEDLNLLSSDEERALMLHLIFFPYVVEAAAQTREPHRLSTYAQELATLFHQFYHNCRIISDDKKLSGTRLLMAEATKQVLKNTLSLMGINAPASM